MHVWTQLAGRSDACGVCVCVWNYRRFASLDLLPFGGVVRCTEGDDIYRHKVVMDSTFAAWCEVKKEFAERLFVKLWMLGFSFDMSERMSEDMSESMSKDMSERMSEDMSERMSKDMSGNMSERYVKKNARRYVRRNVRKICQKIYQKICQKACQNICQKERQKIASSQSAKLRVTEHISGDELYVYPHLTRSGWHKSDGCGSLSE